MLSADVERIKEVAPRGGPFAFPAAVAASLLKRASPIQPSTRNVADYDVVILGCPVWASNMATPMRSYILRENSGIRQVGLVCTLGGSGGRATVAGMAALCGRTPIADLIIDQPAFVSGTWRGKTEAFARQLQALPSASHSPAARGLAAA